MLSTVQTWNKDYSCPKHLTGSLISAQVMDTKTIQVPENDHPYKGRAQYTPTGIRFTSVTRKDTGKYICEVLWTGSGGSGELSKSEVDLIVQVPPSKPVAKGPTSVTIGNKAVLKCVETDGSPPPTFQWYKDNILMPSNPKINEKFRNSSYTIDTKTGVLTIEPVTSFDTGDYFCEAQNNVGTAQKSEAIHLEATEVNVGGIVAAVVVLLIVLALVAFGIWFAYSRGFFSRLLISCDVVVLARTLQGYCKGFGLDDDSLEKLAAQMGQPVEQMKAVIKSPLAKEISNILVVQLLLQAGSEAPKLAKEVLSSVPLLGSLASGALSFATTYKMLRSFVNAVAADAQRVLIKAFNLDAKK
ncbi:Junctional adhesion molecule A [Chelonia mydas]|uniref:Junctional adhesion molecule A n=1 Tax=Chelonia mydas TaxID=8469 RepID=M7AZ30_CHEMY|nr:Junctional adhesion molecule A [Chelonia mydas]